MSRRRFTMFFGTIGVVMAMLFAVAPTHAVRHAVNEWLHHAASDAQHVGHDPGAHGSCLVAGAADLAGHPLSALHEHHSHPQQCCEAQAPLNVARTAVVGASDWSAVLFVAAYMDSQLDPQRTPPRYVVSNPPPSSPAMLSLRSIVLLT